MTALVDGLREEVRALKAENKELRERLESQRRQLGGTNAALSRAQQRAKDLQSENDALRKSYAVMAESLAERGRGGDGGGHA